MNSRRLASRTSGCGRGRGRPPFQLQTALFRTVARDCCVIVDTNRYSVPVAFIGREVEVHHGPHDTLCVYAQGQLIATHPRQEARYQRLVEPAHIAGLSGGPASPGPAGSGGRRVP